MTNNFYPNTRVILVNTKMFRQDNLYKKAVFLSKSYHSFEFPVQEILITIANYKFVFFPLNFNVNFFFGKNDEILNIRNISSIRDLLKIQRFSPYIYTFDEIVSALSDPVICYKSKIK